MGDLRAAVSRGLLTASNGGITIPAVPAFTITDKANATSGVNYAITGSTAGTTNTVQYRSSPTGNWTTGGSRTGDGTGTFSVSAGQYWFKVQSENADGAQSCNGGIRGYVTVGTSTILDRILDNVVSMINDASLTNYDGDTVTAEKEWPPNFTDVDTSIIKVFPGSNSPDNDMSQVDTYTYNVACYICERTTGIRGSNELLMRRQLTRLFSGKRLDSVTDVWCREVGDSETFENRAIEEKHLFLSPINLVFASRELRSANEATAQFTYSLTADGTYSISS
jgi:hypothetical protein